MKMADDDYTELLGPAPYQMSGTSLRKLYFPSDPGCVSHSHSLSLSGSDSGILVYAKGMTGGGSDEEVQSEGRAYVLFLGSLLFGNLYISSFLNPTSFWVFLETSFSRVAVVAKQPCSCDWRKGV